MKILTGVAGSWGMAIWLAGTCFPATAEEAIVPTEPVKLFNGRNLDGLYTWLQDGGYEDPRRVFTVTNGWLRISGEGLGYIGTRKVYRDYRVIVEFKWGDKNWAWGDRIGKARDSGIFMHATGPDGNSHDGNGAFMAAIECNIFQGALGDFLLIRGQGEGGALIAPRLTARVAEERDADGWPRWDPAGQRLTLERWGRLNWRSKAEAWEDRLDFRGPQDVAKDRGEWNRIECVCDGGRIEVRVNGRLVNRAEAVWPHAGKILLQCEGSEIFFRTWELRPLSVSR